MVNFFFILPAFMEILVFWGAYFSNLWHFTLTKYICFQYIPKLKITCVSIIRISSKFHTLFTRMKSYLLQYTVALKNHVHILIIFGKFTESRPADWKIYLWTTYTAKIYGTVESRTHNPGMLQACICHWAKVI